MSMGEPGENHTPGPARAPPNAPKRARLGSLGSGHRGQIGGPNQMDTQPIYYADHTGNRLTDQLGDQLLGEGYTVCCVKLHQSQLLADMCGPHPHWKQASNGDGDEASFVHQDSRTVSTFTLIMMVL